jgi:hypothetical protein
MTVVLRKDGTRDGNGQGAAASRSAATPSPEGMRAGTNGTEPPGASLQLSGSGVLMRIRSAAPFTAKAFVLSSPDRLVVDLTGDFASLRPPVIPADIPVTGARLGNRPDARRLVLDLTRPVKNYTKVQVSDTLLEVYFQ